MEGHLRALLDLLGAHPELALAAVFAGALLEAAALIGTFIPGSTFVFLGGVLVGTGTLPAWPTAAAALAGAILGDAGSYWLGHRYGERLARAWPLRDHPALLARGRAYFARNGGRSVFVGRFLGPVRAIVPVIAGMSGMHPGRFLLLNVLSAIAWAAAHLLPGWLFGASLQLAGAISGRLAVLVVLASLVAWLVARLLQAAFTLVTPLARHLRDRALQWAAARRSVPARAVRALLDPARPESGVLLASALILIGGAWLFLGVLEDVLGNDPLVSFDRAFDVALQGLRTHWGDRAMVFVTELGGTPGIVAVLAVIAFVLWLRRDFVTLLYWLAAAAFAEALVWVLKVTLGRARPDESYQGLQQFSFPSGHVALSIVVYGFLAFLLCRGHGSRVRAAVTLLVAAWVALIGFSRLYLGVHWLSDVLASTGLGLAWVALLGIAYMNHVQGPSLRLVPGALLALGTLAIVGVAYVGPRVDTDVERYAARSALPVMSSAGWLQGGWRELPRERTDATGKGRELLALQVEATRAGLIDALRAGGWRAPPSWASAALLQWLLPHPRPLDLPVLPKLDVGEAAAIVLIAPVDATHRRVVRFWDVRRVDERATAATRRLWVGMVTTERQQPLLGLFTLMRTVPGDEAGVRAVEQDLAAGGFVLRLESWEGAPVVLAAPATPAT